MVASMVSDNLMVFSGNANPKLAHAVVQHLNIPLGRAEVSRFSDGEIMVEINENVRGKDVFVLQSTCAPTNDNLMELVIMVDALKRASAGRITAAIPYFGYARQDRRPHSARVLAKRIESDLAIIDKRRPRANVAEVMNIIGEVEDRTCVIMDDMIDTANTLCQAAKALSERGARQVFAYCTHPVLSGKAVERINESVLDEVVVTDTIPLDPEAAACRKIRQLSCAALLGETISRISRGDSVSSLFVE